MDDVQQFLASLGDPEAAAKARLRLPPAPPGLAANLRAERARRRWSRQELSERCAALGGVSVDTIGSLERGLTAKPELLERVAAALGLAVEQLTGQTEAA